jgi:DNA primase
MTFISPDTAEKIRNAADIVEYIRQYLELKQRGGNFVGLCPFHQEKTPSFNVSPQRRRYHCFGCDADGDIISFVMHMEGMTFPEAVRFLAERYGIPLEFDRDPRRGEHQSLRESLRQVYSRAADYYRRQLQVALEKSAPDSPIREYILHRQLQKETLEVFQVGFAPDGWDNLQQQLRSAQIPPQVLLKSGLFARSRQGSLYDVFRNRLMFPLLNLSGQVIAFGGRIYRSDDDNPKYINSPEHPLYHKGKELYGLYQNRGGIRRRGFALLVEGYMDLLTLYQHGIRNAVASMGTALTADQAFLLKRYADRATILYDADTAGAKATVRAADLLIAAGVAVQVLQLPAGHDPDSFLKENSTEDFQQLLEHAVDIFQYRFDRFYRENPDPTPHVFSEFLNSLLQTVTRMDDLFEQQNTLQRIARFGKLRPEDLTSALRKLTRRQAARQATVTIPDTPALTGNPKLRAVLEVFLRNPLLRGAIIKSHLPDLVEPSPLLNLFLELAALEMEQVITEDTLRQAFCNTDFRVA